MRQFLLLVSAWLMTAFVCLGQNPTLDATFIIDIDKCEGDTFDIFKGEVIFAHQKFAYTVALNCSAKIEYNKANKEEFTISGGTLIAKVGSDYYDPTYDYTGYRFDYIRFIAKESTQIIIKNVNRQDPYKIDEECKANVVDLSADFTYTYTYIYNIHVRAASKKAPQLTADKYTVQPHTEEVTLSVTGCDQQYPSVQWYSSTSPTWQLSGVNSFQQTVKLHESTVFYARCTDNVCSSDWSNGVRISVPEEPKEVTIKHYHQLPQNDLFKDPFLLTEGTSFSLCADKSEASVFALSAKGYDLNQANIELPGTEESQYGSYTIIHQSKDSLAIRYKHPDYIQADGESVSLEVKVYEASSGSEPIETFNILVYRAPVLMVHGIWSGPETFEDMERALAHSNKYPTALNLFKRADYAKTTSQAFLTNVPHIKSELDFFIKSLRDSHLAAGNVDYVAHSMGGILGRLYLQGDTYQCGFHKLITLNTPHSGTELANLYEWIKTTFPPKYSGILCKALLPVFTKSTEQDMCDGALDNLRVNSPVITNTLNGLLRNYRTVPSHTIVTVEYQTPSEIIVGLFKTVAEELESLEVTPKNIINGVGKYTFTDVLPHMMIDITTSQLYDGLNDLIVPQISQQAGMMGNCTSLIENQAHMGSPKNSEVIDRVQYLLAATPSSSYFCQYFNTAVLRSPTPPLYEPASATLTVASPQRGQVIQKGKTVPISIQSANVSETKVIIEHSTTEVKTARTNSHTITAEVPVSNEDGPKRIIVIGKTSSGAYIADTTYFIVSGIANVNQCSSLQSGDWTSSSTWSCGHEPTIDDIVVINPGHTVTVSTMTAQALQVKYTGGRIQFAPGVRQVFVKGGGG
ncbi:esterase/lipase family protein [Spirosoma panaciterrae]|uniref:esterase/lipase family protein n=1 Tax=Spirosoma panaciterrae TaxID=496058 RepID=UPI00037F52FD|nr:hypothetical protein [Spirosoma panaciterrae]